MNDERTGTGSDLLLSSAIAAFRAGDRSTARQKLAQATLADPYNPDLWRWLSRCVDDPAQQQECLERARQLEHRALHEPASVHSTTRAQETPPMLTSAHAQTTEPTPTLPHRRRRRGMLVLALIALIAFIALVLRSRLTAIQVPGAWRTNPDPASVRASGIIEADELAVASPSGGLLAALPSAQPRPGERVEARDPIVRLDTTVLDAQIEAARAAVALAQAGLERAQTGARPGEIAVAQAELFQAQQVRLAAAQAVSDTTALVRNPQEIRLQIALLEAQIQAEQHHLAQRLALKNAAEIAKDAFEGAQGRINDAGGPGRHRIEAPGVPGGIVYYTVPSLPLEAHLAPNRWWQAWVGVNATAAQKEGLEASLAHLTAQLQNPQALEAQADQARAAWAQAGAQVRAAQARLDGLKAGATTEQLAALQARVGQAQAALEALLDSRSRKTIYAPADGVVLEIVTHPGEIAAPGATVLTLADLSQVRLVVYIPEPLLGRVHLGQAVEVTVDSFAGRVFQGRVTHIADRAEFTPRNVATSEERANLVFAVEIDLPNEDGALKPGMPADAVLR